jgi:tRNAThr (cytosine32-N3)-methyltransferase
LVFLSSEISAFAATHADYSEAKYVDILAKTWRKMGPRGRELAQGLELSPGIRALVERALASTAAPIGRTT